MNKGKLYLIPTILGEGTQEATLPSPILKAIQEINGVPIVFNTSFNLHGESMVETIYDAVHTCNESEINHLYVPEDQDIEIPYDLIQVKGQFQIDNEETNRNTT